MPWRHRLASAETGRPQREQTNSRSPMGATYTSNQRAHMNTRTAPPPNINDLLFGVGDRRLAALEAFERGQNIGNGTYFYGAGLVISEPPKVAAIAAAVCSTFPIKRTHQVG